MKKLTVLLILSLILVTAVFADSTYQPTEALVIPYEAIAGIPIGSNYYHSDTSGGWDGGTVITKSKAENYTAKEMIGIIMFLNSEDEVDMNGTITLTVTCPNGFYLVSESNPNYKRPFEIMLFGSFTSEEKDKTWKISEREPTKTITINKSATDYHNAQIHFDVVIRLPGDTNYNTDECKCDGKIYPLGDFEDYSAVVTFNVTYTPKNSSEKTLKKTVTIPFSGYYRGQEPTKDDTTSGVSMSIILNSEAYNIDIKSKLGKTINIGSIYYSMLIGKNQTTTPYNAAIFFSSSSDPYDKNATKFKLVKDDVGANDPLTSINSVGFNLTVTSYDDDTSITFDGSTYFDDPTVSGSSSASGDMSEKTFGKKITGTQVLTSTKYIIPKLYSEYMKSYNSNWWGEITSIENYLYYSYSGKIDLTLDDNVVTMLSGRYVETVYIHVMSYK